MTALGILALASALSAAPAAAGAQPPENPFLAYQPGRGEKFTRHFFFHRPGVAFEEARADVTECRSYASSAMVWPREPWSVPPDPKILPPVVVVGGMVGGLIFSALEGGERNKIAAANMRKCMGFKGYDRYGLSDILWEQLNAGTPEEVALRQARLASGQPPSGRKLDP